MTDIDKVKARYKEMTAPGSFYEQNGGRFKGQNLMTPSEEASYVARLIEDETAAPDEPVNMEVVDATPIGGLAPGDLLVLRPAEPLTREAAEALAVHVSSLMPDIKVLVTDPGLTVTPMRFTAGGTCVVKLSDPMPAEHVAMIKAQFAAVLPEGVGVLVMDPGLEFDPVGSSAEEGKAIAWRAAAIAPFVNDLAGMGRAELNREINSAAAKIEEEEPWLEALTARLAELDAAAKHPVTYHATEEGDPWAIYREGEWPAECITRQDVIDAIKLYDETTAEEWAADNAELPAVSVFYLTGIRPETPATKKRRGDDDDAPLDEEGIWFCDAGEPGAYPVTGFKL